MNQDFDKQKKERVGLLKENKKFNTDIGSEKKTSGGGTKKDNSSYKKTSDHISVLQTYGEDVESVTEKINKTNGEEGVINPHKNSLEEKNNTLQIDKKNFSNKNGDTSGREKLQKKIGTGKDVRESELEFKDESGISQEGEYLSALRTYKHDIENLVKKEGMPGIAKKEAEEIERIKKQELNIKKEVYALQMKEHAVNTDVQKLNTLVDNSQKIQSGKKDRVVNIMKSDTQQTLKKQGDIFAIRKTQFQGREKLSEIKRQKKILEGGGIEVVNARDLYKKPQRKGGLGILKIVTILIPIIFVLAGIFFLVGIFFLNEDSQNKLVRLTPRGTIFSDLHTTQPVSLPYEKVHSSLQKKQKPSILNEIIITKENKKILASEMFAYAKSTPPEQLLNSFTGYYFVGAYAEKKGGSGFMFIAATQSYASTMEGMLAWEIVLSRDIKRIFGLLTTPNESKFMTSTIEGVRVRRLISSTENGDIVYTVTPRGIVIIATSDNTFIEAVRRVRVSFKQDVL